MTTNIHFQAFSQPNQTNDQKNQTNDQIIKMSFLLLFYNLQKFNKVYRIKGLDILSHFEYDGFSMHIL